MQKQKTELTWMPGCQGCGRTECKHNLIPDVTPWAASHFDIKNPYRCNSKREYIASTTVEIGE